MIKTALTRVKCPSCGHQDDEVVDLPFDACEIGKIGQYWTVTYWVGKEITLRLKIRHYSYEFEEELTCEVKLRDATEFCVLGVLRTETFRLACDLPPELDLFPDSYREFAAMARHWARVIEITQVTPSKVAWREGEPVFLDESDDATDDDNAVSEDSSDTPSTTRSHARRAARPMRAVGMLTAQRTSGHSLQQQRLQMSPDGGDGPGC